MNKYINYENRFLIQFKSLISKKIFLINFIFNGFIKLKGIKKHPEQDSECFKYNQEKFK